MEQISEIADAVFRYLTEWLSILLVASILLAVTIYFVISCFMTVRGLKNHVNAVALRKVDKYVRGGGNLDGLVNEIKKPANDVAMVFYICARTNMKAEDMKKHVTYKWYKVINKKRKPLAYGMFMFLGTLALAAVTYSFAVNFDKIDMSAPLFPILGFSVFAVQWLVSLVFYFTTYRKVLMYWREFINLFAAVNKNFGTFLDTHASDYESFCAKLISDIVVFTNSRRRVERIINKILSKQIKLQNREFEIANKMEQMQLQRVVQIKPNTNSQEVIVHEDKAPETEKAVEPDMPQFVSVGMKPMMQASATMQNMMNSMGQNKSPSSDGDTTSMLMQQMLNMMQQNMMHTQLLQQNMQQAHIIQTNQILQPAMQQHLMQNQHMMQNSNTMQQALLMQNIQNMMFSRNMAQQQQQSQFQQNRQIPIMPSMNMGMSGMGGMNSMGMMGMGMGNRGMGMGISPMGGMNGMGGGMMSPMPMPGMPSQITAEAKKVDNTPAAAEDLKTVSPVPDAAEKADAPAPKESKPGKPISMRPFEELNKAFEKKIKAIFGEKAIVRPAGPVVFLEPKRAPSKIEKRLETFFNAKVIKYQGDEWESLKNNSFV